MDEHSPLARRVKVGPFFVHDSPAQEVVEHVAQMVGTRQRAVAYALHVGGLNHYRDGAFAAALDSATLVYADGAAVVALARMAGADHITRAATTDIGVEIIRRASDTLGRTCRLALIGGADGVAFEAGASLEKSANCEVVLADHGFHSSDGDLLRRINAALPDILIVGLGMPREAKWVHAHWADLPETLIMTCGGWFGFLAGHERRAPLVMQVTGTEWLYRLL